MYMPFGKSWIESVEISVFQQVDPKGVALSPTSISCLRRVQTGMPRAPEHFQRRLDQEIRVKPATGVTPAIAHCLHCGISEFNTHRVERFAHMQLTSSLYRR